VKLKNLIASNALLLSSILFFNSVWASAQEEAFVLSSACIVIRLLSVANSYSVIVEAAADCTSTGTANKIFVGKNGDGTPVYVEGDPGSLNVYIDGKKIN
jgi:hypothetical protein